MVKDLNSIDVTKGAYDLLQIYLESQICRRISEKCSLQFWTTNRTKLGDMLSCLETIMGWMHNATTLETTTSSVEWWSDRWPAYEYPTWQCLIRSPTIRTTFSYANVKMRLSCLPHCCSSPMDTPRRRQPKPRHNRSRNIQDRKKWCCSSCMKKFLNARWLDHHKCRSSRLCNRSPAE